ncbi:imm11 family protein [Jannaschia sp. W003]|uniref:imm11 family protein n=1 Tax=Jannaschia sp. W003 TaxID=2867012 RepID=UPI0021A855BE|nr:DUF1629 domain-containing protein [Jannaschia sp. W003]UWQ20643.1 hypothetical protein K3554_11710 [Jannaschia sp. W003]
MTYVITVSSVNPRGGFIKAGNAEWMKHVVSLDFDISDVIQGKENRLLSLDDVPEYFVLKRARTDLPDMFWGSAQLIIVSERYRDIIEDLDPGVHQMWPMEIRRRRAGPVPGKWFGLNVRARAKTIVKERSSVQVSRGGTQVFGIVTRSMTFIDHMKFNLAVDETIEVGHNLWWDNTLDEAALFCSDAFHDAVVEAGLKSIPFKKCVS